MNEQQVVDLMKSSRSEAEWSRNIDTIKASSGGTYPDFWYQSIVLSGLAERVANSYGSTTHLSPVSIPSVTKVDRPLSLFTRPTKLPFLTNAETIVGIYNQGLGEKECPCPTLNDMQDLYDSYAQGLAISLRWVIRS